MVYLLHDFALVSGDTYNGDCSRISHCSSNRDNYTKPSDSTTGATFYDANIPKRLIYIQLIKFKSSRPKITSPYDLALYRSTSLIGWRNW